MACTGFKGREYVEIGVSAVPSAHVGCITVVSIGVKDMPLESSEMGLPYSCNLHVTYLNLDVSDSSWERRNAVISTVTQLAGIVVTVDLGDFDKTTSRESRH